MPDRPSDDAIVSAMQAEFVHLLTEAMRKIRHCVSQLSDEQVWHRAAEGQNSVANLLLHLSGNLQQWCVAGIADSADDRDRQAEFDADGGLTGKELLERLQATVDAAFVTIRALDRGQLLDRRSIQEYDVTVMGALFHTVPHFVGHTHQIILLTRQTLGADYRVHWSPDHERNRVSL